MPSVKVSVYGLKLTCPVYLLIQLTCFLWVLALYAFWRWKGLDAHPNWWIRQLDVALALCVLYGLAETILVLKKFRKAYASAPGLEKKGESGAGKADL